MPRQAVKRTHHLPRRNQRPQNLWRETAEGRQALTERVKRGGHDHDRKSKTMAEVLGFDPDRMW